jgi:hypothetical protein
MGRSFVLLSGRETPPAPVIGTREGEPISLEPLRRIGPGHPPGRDPERTVAAREASAEVIVLDPLYSAHDQDENDTRSMAALCQSLLRLRDASKAALIVVHHVRKSIGRDEIGRAFRGSSALHAVGDSYAGRYMMALVKEIEIVGEAATRILRKIVSPHGRETRLDDRAHSVYNRTQMMGPHMGPPPKRERISANTGFVLPMQ